MKRIHLFEIEDFSWCPNWYRIRLTRLVALMHRLVKTEDKIIKILQPILKENGQNNITDLCSGSGGPMINIVKQLRKDNDFRNLSLTLTDLYPNIAMVKQYEKSSFIKYKADAVDATKNSQLKGLKTMISSFHHMKPENAKKILASAKENNDTIFIYEISDNGFPLIANLFTFFFNFINCFFITPFVRPMSWQQIVFTYFIPIIPFGFAWDGAVSNARTYTLSDLDELLIGLTDGNYVWEKGIVDGKIPSLYLIGKPA